MKLQVEIQDITWECGDCGNRYDYSISGCPNSLLDKLIINNRLKNNIFKGDAYCVKCKVPREFEGKIKTSDSGRRMAVGKCYECGTKLNRILGKAQ